MTWREIISLIKTSLKETNSDSRLTNKYIYSVILKVTSLLIQRESDSLKLNSLLKLFQTLKCFPIIEVSDSEETCGLDKYCKVYRSKIKIPDFFEDSDGIIMKGIYTVNHSRKITLLSVNDIIRRKQDRINSKYDKSIYAFIKNNYLYLTDRIDYVQIEGLFKNDISKLNNSNCFPDNLDNVSCISFLDTPAPIPAKLEQAIVTETIKMIATTYKATKEDPVVDKTIK